jgi:hypothetical protein
VRAPWQLRVVEEAHDLSAKLDRIIAFLESDVYAGLTIKEQELLTDQRWAMHKYLAILNERIATFPPPAQTEPEKWKEGERGMS